MMRPPERGQQAQMQCKNQFWKEGGRRRTSVQPASCERTLSWHLRGRQGPPCAPPLSAAPRSAPRPSPAAEQKGLFIHIRACSSPFGTAGAQLSRLHLPARGACSPPTQRAAPTMQTRAFLGRPLWCQMSATVCPALRLLQVSTSTRRCSTCKRGRRRAERLGASLPCVLLPGVNAAAGRGGSLLAWRRAAPP